MIIRILRANDNTHVQSQKASICLLFKFADSVLLILLAHL